MPIIFLLLILVVGQFATAKIEFDSIKVGIDQCYKANHWTTVQVNVISQHEPFEGQLQLQVNEVINGRRDQTYFYPLILQPVDRRRFSFLVYIPDYSVEIKLELVSNFGEQRLVNIVSPSVPKSVGSVLVLVVSPTRSHVDELTDQTVVKYITPTGLPTNWIAYESFDLMILHQVRLNKRYFPPAKQTAILDWICRGGTLLLSVDNHHQPHFLSPFLNTEKKSQSSNIRLYSLGHGRLGVIPFDLEQITDEFGDDFFSNYAVSPRKAEGQYEPFRRYREQIHQHLKSLKPSSSPRILYLVIFFSSYFLVLWWVSRQTYRHYLILSIVVPFLFVLISVFPFLPHQITVNRFSIATIYGQRERLHLKTYFSLIGQKQDQINLRLPSQLVVQSQESGIQWVYTPTGFSTQITCGPWQMNILETETFLDMKEKDQKMLMKGLSTTWKITDKRATLLGTGDANNENLSYREFQSKFHRPSLTNILTNQQAIYAQIISRQNLVRHLFKEPNVKNFGWANLPSKFFPLTLSGNILVKIAGTNSLIITYP